MVQVKHHQKAPHPPHLVLAKLSASLDISQMMVMNHALLVLLTHILILSKQHNAHVVVEVKHQNKAHHHVLTKINANLGISQTMDMHLVLLAQKIRSLPIQEQLNVKAAIILGLHYQVHHHVF